MNTANISQGTAKIYLFPVSPRLAQTRFEREVAEILRNDRRNSAKIAATDGWYHDDASQAERRLT